MANTFRFALLLCSYVARIDIFATFPIDRGIMLPSTKIPAVAQGRLWLVACCQIAGCPSSVRWGDCSPSSSLMEAALLPSVEVRWTCLVQLCLLQRLERIVQHST